MTEADLATYGIRNDGDLEKVVYVGSNSTEVVVTHAAPPRGVTPPKKISIRNKDNAWPEGVAVVADLPREWEIK